LREKLLLLGPWAVALVTLGGQVWAQEAGLRAATGGAAGHRLVVLPKKGSGLYSWALPVTLGGLLQQAQVDTWGMERVAELLKKRGLGDLGGGLPDNWDEEARNAVAEAGQTGKDKGFVLVASWNTREPQEKWGDDTQFWLDAKLQQGEEVRWETRLPQDAGKSYRLGDYDVAVRDLAEMVLATVNPTGAQQAKGSEVWAQRVTLAQVRLLAEAERDVAAGKLEDARTKLGQAQAAAKGQEGSLLALRRLIEVNEALCRQDPGKAGDIGQQAERDGLALAAQGAKTEAWGMLLAAEGRRLQGKWKEAAPAYFAWVQYLVDEKMMQAEEVAPEGLREELNSRRPDVWKRVKGAGEEAAWWGTVGLAVYRSVSGGLAQAIVDRAVECAQKEPDEKARAEALYVLAGQAEYRSDFAGEEGLYKKAIEILEKAAPASLDCAKVYRDLGGAYLIRGDLKGGEEWLGKARAIYERLAAGSGDCARTYNLLGAACLERRDLDGGLEWLQKALAICEKVAPGSLTCAESYSKIAAIYTMAHDFDRALELSRKALEIQERLAPWSLDCGVSYGNIGMIYFARGDFDRALEGLQKAMAIDEKLAPGSPNCATDYDNIASAYGQKGEVDRALEWYRKALAIRERVVPGSPECATTYNNLGTTYLMKGDPDRALEWYQKAVEIRERVTPGSAGCASTYNNMGAAYETKGDAGRALEFYEKALAIRERVAPDSPACATSYNNVAKLLADKGEMDRALELFRKAAVIHERLEPGSVECAETYNNIALLYAFKDDLASAVEWEKKALGVREKLAPKSEEYAAGANLAGSCLVMLGKAEEALPFLTQALAIAPRQPAASVALAFAYIALQRLDDARAVIEDICGMDKETLAGMMARRGPRLAKQLLDGGNPGGYYLIGRVWEAAGKTEDAAGAYETFLKKAKADHPWRGDAEGRLKKLKGG
jgi:tetratricopeptide (TPR) repeat protein